MLVEEEFGLTSRRFNRSITGYTPTKAATLNLPPLQSGTPITLFPGLKPWAEVYSPLRGQTSPHASSNSLSFANPPAPAGQVAISCYPTCMLPARLGSAVDPLSTPGRGAKIRLDAVG